jgi:hypothetical protein
VAVGCSPDGASILTAAASGIVRIWSSGVTNAAPPVQRAGGELIAPARHDAASSESESYYLLSDAELAKLRAHYGITSKERPFYEDPAKTIALTQHDGAVMVWRAGAGRVEVRHAAGTVFDVAVQGRQLYSVGSDGRLLAWNLDDGSSKELWRHDKGALRSVQVVAGSGARTLYVVADHSVFELDATAPESGPRATIELPAAMAPEPATRWFGSTSSHIDGNWLHACTDTQCVMIDRSARRIVVAGSCATRFEIDADLGIVYCAHSVDGVPPVFQPDGTPFPAQFFRSKVIDQLQTLPAGLTFTKLTGCKRAFISLSGGNPDIPFRGEGMLYDFEARREITRTFGDPGPAYEHYGHGIGLPVFCTPAQLVAYARATLAELNRPGRPVGHAGNP